MQLPPTSEKRTVERRAHHKMYVTVRFLRVNPQIKPIESMQRFLQKNYIDR